MTMDGEAQARYWVLRVQLFYATPRRGLSYEPPRGTSTLDPPVF